MTNLKSVRKKSVNNKNTKENGVILLSGGLDSLVSLDIVSKELNKIIALTFDYGQKAFEDEKEASKNIAKHYKIKHKIIKLPFLKKLSSNALTNKDDNNLNTLESVWIPNRNGLFLNIAASFCDKYNYKYIIIGANKEEARDFPDNTKSFIKNAQDFFEYSTLNKVKVFAPCIEFDKIDILNYAIDNKVPLNLLKSCYQDSSITGKKHCGTCMSCKLLYNALQKCKKPDLVKEML